MSILALEATRYMPGRNNNASPAAAESAPTATVVGNGILRCNTPDVEVPDPRYWTAYDYYMIERDARAMRTANMQALVGKGWRALTRRLFG